IKEFSSEFKNVVAIGNLSQRKGFDLLLTVFEKLKEEKIKLFILGDGADKGKLIEQKEKSELINVEFLGNKKNPYSYLAQADLFVLSSRYEGFPNVLLEAGVCGTYALANNCPGGINEIIEEKVNGEIASIENPELFAERIKILCQQNFDKNRIQKSIISRFSKEIILEKYEQVFDELQ
ncbi:MAG: glycosyltransferase, partial [Weeksellaceae bacterium]|nr:glycosyltransferase [Weeksellaceae bacterium]